MIYKYHWGNNPVRRQLKGRACEVLASGRMGSILISMADTGERVITSRRAVRRVPDTCQRVTFSDVASAAIIGAYK